MLNFPRIPFPSPFPASEAVSTQVLELTQPRNPCGKNRAAHPMLPLIESTSHISTLLADAQETRVLLQAQCLKLPRSYLTGLKETSKKLAFVVPISGESVAESHVHRRYFQFSLFFCICAIFHSRHYTCIGLVITGALGRTYSILHFRGAWSQFHISRYPAL